MASSPLKRKCPTIRKIGKDNFINVYLCECLIISIFTRGGSSRKRGKKKKSPKKAEEVNNEIFDDDEVSIISAQSFVEIPKSLTVGDFFPNPAIDRVSTPKPFLKWPNASTLRDDVFKDLCQRFNPLSFHGLYEPLMNPTKPTQSSSTKKTFKCTKNLKNNLTNLDLIDPCTPQNPCILDRMCEFDQDKLNLVKCWQRPFY